VSCTPKKAFEGLYRRGFKNYDWAEEMFRIFSSYCIRIFGEKPIVEGDFYMGDLLVSILNITSGFWEKNPDLQHEFEYIIMGVETTLDAVTPLIKAYRELNH
jgi:hypothetical protein